jgi:hypothetical protein
MYITALCNLLAVKLQFLIVNRYDYMYVYIQCKIHRYTLGPKYMFHRFKIQSCCTKLLGSKGRGTSVIVSLPFPPSSATPDSLSENVTLS